MIHMENVYKGLRRMGYTAMFISSFLIQKYSKELQMNKEY
ncbi:transposase [Bacillus pseudomycoides]|nr:hypothetical protein bmyco0002_6520 [Bacillus pseudomycoides]EEM12527.1 hypothetical protein bmyco0003_6590 [Bacillus pseudomycoides]EEM18395.1 hypothetical protein bpmyx0001_6410 [Bacillus pseudomycoides DSM 12442]